MFDLSGKKALVTGSSRGIGRGIAIALAKQGADVAINYVSSQEKAEEVKKEIEDLGREALVLQADVSNKQQVQNMFAQIKDSWGKLDILVNNAGILRNALLQDITEEMLDEVLGVNLKGQFFCAQQAAALMQDWGRIINIASVSSGGIGISFPQISVYTASKGGVIGMTENLAAELADKGITVNAIAPGAIETDMGGGGDEQTQNAIVQGIPKHKMGQPEDIGAAAAYLASEEAGYVTGVMLNVDGGWLTV